MWEVLDVSSLLGGALGAAQVTFHGVAVAMGEVRRISRYFMFCRLCARSRKDMRTRIHDFVFNLVE